MHGYLLVFDITDNLSFEFLKLLHERLVNPLGLDTVPCILVGMKLDREEDRTVDKTQVEQVAAEWMCPYIECSAKDGIHVDTVFHSLIREMEKPTVQVVRNDSSHCASM